MIDPLASEDRGIRYSVDSWSAVFDPNHVYDDCNPAFFSYCYAHSVLGCRFCTIATKEADNSERVAEALENRTRNEAGTELAAGYSS